MLRQLGSLGILAAIHPALPYDDTCISRLSFGFANLSKDDSTVPPEEKLQILWCLWLQDLEPEDLQAVGQRLRLSGKLLGWIAETQAIWTLLPALTEQKPSEVTQQLENFHPIPNQASQLFPAGGCEYAHRRA